VRSMQSESVPLWQWHVYLTNSQVQWPTRLYGWQRWNQLQWVWFILLLDFLAFKYTYKLLRTSWFVWIVVKLNFWVLNLTQNIDFYSFLLFCFKYFCLFFLTVTMGFIVNKFITIIILGGWVLTESSLFSITHTI